MIEIGTRVVTHVDGVGEDFRNKTAVIVGQTSGGRYTLRFDDYPDGHQGGIWGESAFDVVPPVTDEEVAAAIRSIMEVVP